ncbi:hypothetical protein P879_10767 [Paragonimus westermani]|uniref:Uncharacterized protein n=1 Tax=Paragonimus westermani TaxID=34504 RepID=A0A8T0DC15_9TREM|nr:hypothetical protein P879_10767 [Paragonimus westermani]
MDIFLIPPPPSYAVQLLRLRAVQLEEWFIEKAELIEEVDRQQSHSDHFQSTVDSSEWKDANRAYVAKQYAQLRILESELKANQTRIEAIFQVRNLFQLCIRILTCLNISILFHLPLISQNAVNTVMQHPQLVDPLKARLDELRSRWKGLQSLMQTRLEKMMKLHRGKKLVDCIPFVHLD